jgi:aminopeptidase-like protein
VVQHLGETGRVPLEVRPFDPCGGSDERQFCSPGFDLPVGQIARTVYCHYDGYHNSLDTKEFMGIEPLIETANQVETVLETFEYAGAFHNLSPYGEPQLGRRGLYPNVNNRDTWTHSSDTEFDQRAVLNRILTLLNYSDGSHSMISLAERLEREELLGDRPKGST